MVNEVMKNAHLASCDTVILFSESWIALDDLRQHLG